MLKVEGSSTTAEWGESEDACEIEVVLGALVKRLEDPEALRIALDARDLSLIRSIRVRVGSDAESLATIHLERGTSQSSSPAVTIQVTGRDEEAVGGLTAGLERILRRGQQRPNLFEAQLLALLVVGLSIALAVGLPSWLNLNPHQKISAAGVAVVVFSLITGAVAGFSIWILHPSLEVLSPGQRPRRDRYLGRAATALAFSIGIGLALYLGLR